MDAPSLRRSLGATLAFFDLFDHPLTAVELMRFRYRSPEDRAAPAPSEVAAALRSPEFGEADGYHFLRGRERIAGIRARRYRLAAAKYARARRVVRLMRMLPSVRMVAVCNSLAISNADEESDIDLFVVAAPGTLWATRLIVVGALALLGLRPTGASHADKVCMSFFLSESALDISSLAVLPDDTYLRYWIASLVPLYDAGGVMDAFRRANAWAAIGDGAPSVGRGPRAIPPAPRWTAATLPLLRRIDVAAERFQRRRFPVDIAAAANRDTRVVVTRDVLKFHVNDRRAAFERAFRERAAALEPAVPV